MNLFAKIANLLLIHECLQKKMTTFAAMMNESECVGLLEAHGIKPTANRIVVAKVLAASLQPLSLAELERRIITIDKSNVFRALVLFREHHLVHAVEGTGDGTKYELCHSHSHDHDDDRHPHFFCEVCQQTYCLDYTTVPEIQLPEGFEKTAADLMIRGVCPHCRKKD